jgi:tRNA (guanine-N(7)-)-methyltransferase subunit TRM82
MPKRPVAIAFCYNDQVILAADKFGDVYGLPLIPGKHGSQKMTAGVPSGSATPATGQGYTPKADESTVHTIRNKKALANQKKQAAKNGSTTPAKEPAADFFHKLLLGHVSMLTDITVGRLELKDPDSGKTRTREWIITADRDEHIRTSRTMPQAHIIENFLLGHKEFVSRVHIPEMHPNILISGGGDSYLFVWNYVTGELLAKCEMRHKLVKEFDFDAAAEPPLAVSGIVSYYDKDIDRTRVFVICEKYVTLAFLKTESVSC